MKRPLFVLFFVYLGLLVNGQVKEGQWFINGVNIISAQVGSYQYGGSESADEPEVNFSSFSAGPFTTIPSLVNAPSINYSFTSKLTGGIFINTTFMSEKDGEKINNFGILAGPNLRYYFRDRQAFAPFVEGSVGLGRSSSKTGSAPSVKSDLMGWHLGTGATYFLTPGLGLDFTIGYDNIENKSTDSDSKLTYKFFQFGVGVHFVLNKK